MRLTHCALLLVTALAACDLPTAPPPPADAVEFSPPVVYQRWWDEVQACSGLSGALTSVTWYNAPDSVIDIDGHRYEGVWYPKGNKIVLAVGGQFDGRLVRHEMLHALLRGGGHPRRVFVGRCSGVVACEAECLTALPPTGDPVAQHVASSDMEVGVSTLPAEPSLATDGGYFQVVVTVHNTRSIPVVVDLPEIIPGLYFGYGFQAGPPRGGWQIGERTYESAIEVTRFRPGESRTFLFDLSITDSLGARDGLPPGTYGFQAYFGDAESAARPVITLSP